MRHIPQTLFGLAIAVALAGCSHGLAGVAQTAGTTSHPAAISTHPAGPYYEGALRPDGSAEVCGAPAPGFARCHAIVRLDTTFGISPNIIAYAPADLISAYKLPAAPPTPQTVAIVDAYDDPKAESDLAMYRSTFGLPACTSASGCFKKVNQSGVASPLPAGNTGWAEEISLDLDMVSAICPSCKILLVEATTPTLGNLGKSVDTAVALGANTVSNSYGGSESGYSTANFHYHHPGHAITASSGDSGYAAGPQFPADSQFVTAVGGTHLVKVTTNTRGWRESVWSGAGSGCSAVATKPTWQHDTLCTKRTIADTAAVADPNTGVIVYDSYNITASFYVFGGTSVASPIIASVYALAGNSSAVVYGSFGYSHLTHLFDIKSGSNGSCGGTYLCTGVTGYDGPTGNGSPNGTGAF